MACKNPRGAQPNCTGPGGVKACSFCKMLQPSGPASTLLAPRPVQMVSAHPNGISTNVRSQPPPPPVSVQRSIPIASVPNIGVPNTNVQHHAHSVPVPQSIQASNSNDGSRPLPPLPALKPTIHPVPRSFPKPNTLAITQTEIPATSKPLSQAAAARLALMEKLQKAQETVVSSSKTFETGADPKKLYEAALENLGIQEGELAYVTGLDLRASQFKTEDLENAYQTAWKGIYPLGFKGTKKENNC